MRDYRGPISLVCQRIPRATLEVLILKGEGTFHGFLFFFHSQHVYNIAIPKPPSHLPADSFPTVEDLLCAFSGTRGYLNIHGRPDEARGARIILKDFVSGKVPRFYLVFCDCLVHVTFFSAASSRVPPSVPLGETGWKADPNCDERIQCHWCSSCSGWGGARAKAQEPNDQPEKESGSPIFCAIRNFLCYFLMILWKVADEDEFMRQERLNSIQHHSTGKRFAPLFFWFCVLSKRLTKGREKLLTATRKSWKTLAGNEASSKGPKTCDSEAIERSVWRSVKKIVKSLTVWWKPEPSYWADSIFSWGPKSNMKAIEAVWINEVWGLASCSDFFNFNKIERIDRWAMNPWYVSCPRINIEPFAILFPSFLFSTKCWTLGR